MSRPLRSVLIGDVDYYPSEFAFGVNQAMTRAGHWHSSVNIRWDMGVIVKRLKEVQPDVIWGHMLLWAPGGKTVDLLCLCEQWKKWGAKVLIHDGDARTETRFAADVSPAIDAALCNHKADRSAWHVQQIHWPYFAFDQSELMIANPNPEMACDLAFAGRLDGGIYQGRTMLVQGLQAVLKDRMKVYPGGDFHTLFRTPELAISAGSILGYGRPERNGWLDVRVFQYPGAGGLLIHDDVGGMLEPWRHYIPYKSGSVESVLEVLTQLESDQVGIRPLIRKTAFEYVQANHSATARVRQALRAVDLVL